MSKKKKRTGTQASKQKKPRRAAQKGSAGRSARGASSGGGAGAGEGGASSSSGGGGLMGMRRGIQGLVSGKETKQPKSTLGKAMDIGFWILLAAVLVFILYARLFRDAG